VLRQHIDFMHRDRAMDGEVRTVCELVQRGAFRRAP
jgi:histidine ammonia-lyase